MGSSLAVEGWVPATSWSLETLADKDRDRRQDYIYRQPAGYPGLDVGFGDRIQPVQ